MHQINKGKAADIRFRERIMIYIREPFFHFLIIGTLIYFLYGLLANQTSIETENTITVTAAETDWLVQSWQKRWNRPPTPKERQGLIDAYVKESVMYRQAIAMGLDKDDTIIRRRLAQKLEFLTRDLTEIPSPSKEELRTYFDTHRDQYQTPASLSFTHIYFSPDKRREQVIRDARDALARLQSESASTQRSKGVGDPFMLQKYYPENTQQDILRLFGDEFSREIFQLQVGQWTGPVQSAYGWHLVYVHDRTESIMPEWANVEDIVLQDWVDNRRREVNDKFYASLLSRYEVIVEREEPGQEALALGELQ